MVVFLGQMLLFLILFWILCPWVSQKIDLTHQGYCLTFSRKWCASSFEILFSFCLGIDCFPHQKFVFVWPFQTAISPLSSYLPVPCSSHLCLCSFVRLCLSSAIVRLCEHKMTRRWSRHSCALSSVTPQTFVRSHCCCGVHIVYKQGDMLIRFSFNRIWFNPALERPGTIWMSFKLLVLNMLWTFSCCIWFSNHVMKHWTK